MEQLVLPASMRETIFRAYHDDLGHQGRDRTISLIKQRFYWPGMNSFIENHVTLCGRCIRRKTEISLILKERIKVEKELEMEDDPYRKSESDAQSRGYRYHQTDISKDNEGRRKVDARRQFKTDQPYVGTNQRGRQSMSLRRHYAENETGYGECYPVERELFRREKREPDVINTRRDGQSSGNMLEIVDNEIEFLDMKLKQMRKNSERLKQEMEEKVIIGEKWTHRTEMLPENISRRENKFVQRPIERGSYERNYTPRKHSKVPRASLINELESGILPQTEIETDKTEYRREYRPKWEDITERRDNEAKYCVDYLPRADRRAKIEEDVLPFITRQRRNESTVIINGLKTSALVDSGSEITTVSDEFYKEMIPQPYLHPMEEFKIQGASGNTIPYSGVILCEILALYLLLSVLHLSSLSGRNNACT